MQKLQPLKLVGATLALLGAWSCTKSGIDRVEPQQAPFFNKGDIGFYEIDHSSKTALSENGVSLVWENGDQVRVWAADSKNSLSLKAQPFTIYAGSGLGRSYFTSSLPAAMAEGTYNYVACYPAPTSTDSTTISFKLPSKQDGTIGKVDFMLTEPVEAGRLKPLEKVEDYSYISFNFKHKFHILRFFIPGDHQGAEGGLSGFSFKMPVNVVGSYVTDIYNQQDNYISEEGLSSKVDMALATPLMPSRNGRQYAYAAIIPFQSKEGDRLYFSTDTINVKTTFNTIDLQGRNFQAGHMTSVAVKPVISDSRDLCVKFTGNELGEPVKKLRLRGPEGLVWAESGSNVYDIPSSGDTVAFGTSVKTGYSISRAIYEAKKGDIVLEMESDHFRCKGFIALNENNIDDFHLYAEFATPKILWEDFSGMDTFHNADEYVGGSNAGAKGPYSFLDGWGGGRIGGEAGKCVRLAARRECGLGIEARYPSRLDSSLLPEIIAPVDLEVEFDYGTNVQGGRELDQTFWFGYSNNQALVKSDNTSGVFVHSQTVSKDDKDGSWDSTPKHLKITLEQVPANPYTRISWRNTCSSYRSFGDNTSSFLYIDNVKVSVKKQEATE